MATLTQPELTDTQSNAKAPADAAAPTVRAGARVAASDRYSVSEANDRAGVVALAECWQALERASAGSTVFQSYAFCLAWLDAYAFGDAASHRARVIAVHNSAGALMALAPFAEQRRGLVRFGEWIGEPLLQYGDILLHPDANAEAVGRALSDALSRWTAHGLHLRNVRDDSRIGRVLTLETGRVGDRREAGLIDFAAAGSADAYFKRFSRASRKSLRLKKRRLDTLGTVTFEQVEPGERCARLCHQAIGWKIDWLAQRGLSSRAFQDPTSLQTLVALASTPGQGNPLRVFALTLNGAPIAIEVSFVEPEAVLSFMGSYDPAYEEFSPGKLQLEGSVLFGYENGWTGYDLLAPMNAYKASWVTDLIGVADTVLPLTMTGRMYARVVLQRLRPAAKALVMALPVVLRSRLFGRAGLTSL
ncbi:MAG: GNAT family N-acetyltransferase [Devosiaceae bacterium]|nr:GNAT family N-acetyltransferase [Devosiaceae bacterium MH13]